MPGYYANNFFNYQHYRIDYCRCGANPSLKKKVISMGATSTASKNKYNKKAYESFNVRIKPELFERIDNYCSSNGLSRSQFLLKAINLLSPDTGK